MPRPAPTHSFPRSTQEDTAPPETPPPQRQFIAWDSEGSTVPDGVRQPLILWGCSTGERIRTERPGISLKTRDCLDLMIEVANKYPRSYHVIFSGSYDFSQILQGEDFPDQKRQQIYDHHQVRWSPPGAYRYFIEYIPRKWFSVKRTPKGTKGKTKGKNYIKIEDVWSFFATSFVNVVKDFEEKYEDVAAIANMQQLIAGKANRRSFQWQELDDIIVPYWELELKLLVAIMNNFRASMESVGLFLRGWYGPGAVANQVFSLHKIKNAMAKSPPEVREAAQYAYAGGHVEQFRVGNYNGPVHVYDINSAYPSAYRYLPNLQKGFWHYVTTFDPDSFGVWHVNYSNSIESIFGQGRPHPFFRRDKHGNISFPSKVEGWYWTPEAALWPEAVIGGWVFVEEDKTDRPFDFINDYFNRRLELKAAGEPAQYALKVAMNSIYGKSVQRVGWDEEKFRPPKWHQLEWGGYVTSYCRAMIYEAIMQNPESVIGCETDSVITMSELDLPLGKRLGEWSHEVYDGICYLQTGVYYKIIDGVPIPKSRGFDKDALSPEGSLSYRKILDYLDRVDRGENPGYPSGSTHRFVGYTFARQLRKPHLACSWITKDHDLHIGGGSKRKHIKAFCWECFCGDPMTKTMHSMMVPSRGGKSYPHPLPWERSRELQFGELAEMDRVWK